MMTTRRRKRHSPEHIVKKLRDPDAMLNAGKDLAAVLPALEASLGAGMNRGGRRGHGERVRLSATLNSLRPVWLMPPMLEALRPVVD